MAEPHHFPATVSAPSTLQSGPIESNLDHRDGDQTSQQPTVSMARTEMVEMDMFRHGAQPCHPSVDPGLGGSGDIGEGPGTDAAAPSGADGNVSSGTISIGLV